MNKLNPSIAQGLVLAPAALCLLLAGGCNSSASPSGGTNPQGTVRSKPDGSAFIVDDNDRGLGQEILISRLVWGRLVQVFGLGAGGERVVMQDDFVITGSFAESPGEVLLERNPVTGQETMIILRDVTDTTPGGGRAQFFNILQESERNLAPIFDQSGGSGLFSMVPRNAAIVVHMDDLLEPSLVSGETVRVTAGVPAVTPFEARVVADPNHGDLTDRNGDGVAEFYSTRVIIDPTISEVESFEVDPPLEVNGVGFPASVSVSLSNLRVAIPSVPSNSVGQEVVIQNLSGHRLSTANNGTVDFTVPTLPIVRSMRSGGASEVTADPFNGFLPDNDPPLLVGTQPVNIDTVPIQDALDPEVFVIDQLSFASVSCAQTPAVGDVLRQPGIFAEVVEDSQPQSGGTVDGVRVRLILFPDSFDGPGDWAGSALGAADFLSTYESQLDAGKEMCFVRITPTPTGFPLNPTAGLRTDSKLTLRFSEPMDPLSLTAFDSMTLTRLPQPQNNSQYVVGSVEQTRDLQEFTFDPTVDLAHNVGTSELYYLSLNSGQFGPSDLAGNGLAFNLPQVTLSIEPNEPTAANGGRVTRFSQPDEDEPFGGTEGPLPEWSGQFFYDLNRQLIRPRPVTRYIALADRSQAVPALMTPFTQGIATPLVPLGSRMQAIWRYVDVGFSLTDTSNHNVDVEGISWSPASGQPTADHYEQFEIRMSHCRHAPDEFIDPASLFPMWNLSGLKPAYANNIMDADIEPQVVVHPRQRGYTIDPGDAFTATSGTRLMPWPVNRDASQPAQRFTWRNTALGQHRSGGQNNGVDPDQLGVALGTDVDKVYSVNEIQTIGLPLMIEYRCYPDQGAVGFNALDISLAANSSSRPWFRGFTSGGFGSGGTPVTIDPDLEITANGGFNPGSNPPGGSTPGNDNVVYVGAMDLVVRISRAVSIWFEASNPSGGGFAAPSYNPIVVEPDINDRPFGTNLIFSFRGAIAVGGSSADAATNANTLDIYGNHYPGPDQMGNAPPHDSGNENQTIAFYQANQLWSDFDPTAPDPLGISGAPYYQVRVTFVSNVDSGLSPELSALAVSWVQ